MPGSKTAQKSVLHFKTVKKDYQQKADLEQGVKTLRVRFSLGWLGSPTSSESD